MTRKKLFEESAAESENWLELVRLATLEVTSEEADHSIKHAPTKGSDQWSASTTSEQTISMRFDEAERISRIFLLLQGGRHIAESGVSDPRVPVAPATQKEIRQQFNLTPPNTAEVRENFLVGLEGICGLFENAPAGTRIIIATA